MTPTLLRSPVRPGSDDNAFGVSIDGLETRRCNFCVAAIRAVTGFVIGFGGLLVAAGEFVERAAIPETPRRVIDSFV